MNIKRYLLGSDSLFHFCSCTRKVKTNKFVLKHKGEWCVAIVTHCLMSDVTSEGAGEDTGDTDWELLRELRGVTDWNDDK